MNEQPRFTLESDDGVLVEVVSADDVQARAVKLNYTAEQRQTLSHLVDLAVRAAMSTGQYLLNGNTVKLVIKPELQQALKTGAARMSENNGSFAATIISTGEKGGIAGNLRFRPANAAKFANLAAVAWQVAAIATAQHYLKEIDDKLQTVSQEVRTITEFLNNKQNAELAAAQESLRLELEVFLQDPLVEENRAKLLTTVPRVFELAQTNCILRMTALRNLSQQVQTTDAHDLWERAMPEAQAFAFALAVGAEAVTAAQMARETQPRSNALHRNLENSISGFVVALDELEASYTARLLENQAKERDVLPRWKGILTAPQHQLQERQRKKRYTKWKDAGDSVKAQAESVRSAVKSIEEALTQAAETPRLASGKPQDLPLLVRLNGAGEVEEVYLQE